MLRVLTGRVSLLVQNGTVLCSIPSHFEHSSRVSAIRRGRSVVRDPGLSVFLHSYHSGSCGHQCRTHEPLAKMRLSEVATAQNDADDRG